MTLSLSLSTDSDLREVSTVNLAQTEWWWWVGFTVCNTTICLPFMFAFQQRPPRRISLSRSLLLSLSVSVWPENFLAGAAHVLSYHWFSVYSAWFLNSEITDIHHIVSPSADQCYFCFSTIIHCSFCITLLLLSWHCVSSIFLCLEWENELLSLKLFQWKTTACLSSVCSAAQKELSPTELMYTFN